MPLDNPFIQPTRAPATPSLPSGRRVSHLMLVDENFDVGLIVIGAARAVPGGETSSPPPDPAPVDQSGFFLGSMRLG